MIDEWQANFIEIMLTLIGWFFFRNKSMWAQFVGAAIGFACAEAFYYVANSHNWILK